MVLEAMASGSRGIIHQREGYQSALGSGCCHKGVMAARQPNLAQQRHRCLTNVSLASGVCFHRGIGRLKPLTQLKAKSILADS